MLTPTNHVTVYPPGGDLVTTTITYDYDPLYRLITATHSSGEVYTYTYDPVGNRQAMGINGEVITYTYDAGAPWPPANRLTWVDDVEYTWDDGDQRSHGNLLDNGVFGYTYDRGDHRSPANRLVSVEDMTTTAVYTYNGDGHRAAKAVDGVTTTYVVAVLGLSQVLVETTGGESIVYLYGHDLLGEEGTTWVWHLGDGLGSVRQLADSNGHVTLAQGYTPFGVPLWDEGGGATGYGFTGERWEAYSELVFLRARYYEPGTGRFLNRDPWPGSFQIPGTLHAFAYVLNNAPNGTDPTGMWCIFGLGDCDTDPDLAAVAYYYLVQTNFCVTIGDTWCWGGEDQGIDIWDPANNEMFYDDMYWTWYHPAQAWGLSEEDLRSRLIEDWFFEQGAAEWYFDDRHPATQALMSHEGVNKYRQEFYRGGCRDIGDRNNPSDHGKWWEPGDNTPLDRLLGESDLDRVYLQFSCEGALAGQILLNTEYNEASVCGTLGSYAVKILNNNDGTASFEVYNPTSWESFLRPPFAWMPTLGKPERWETSSNWFCEEGCGGNVSQHFRWTEIILPGLCGYCPSWGPRQ